MRNDSHTRPQDGNIKWWNDFLKSFHQFHQVRLRTCPAILPQDGNRNWWNDFLKSFHQLHLHRVRFIRTCPAIPPQDGNIKWNWWNDFMNKKRLGEIDKDMPGYMYAKWQNSLEKVGVTTS